MSRQVHNLARLYSKMQARYGEGDALVQELKRTLDAANSKAAHMRKGVGEHLMTRSTEANVNEQYRGSHGASAPAAY